MGCDWVMCCFILLQGLIVLVVVNFGWYICLNVDLGWYLFIVIGVVYCLVGVLVLEILGCCSQQCVK